MPEKFIFEYSGKGKTGVSLPENDCPETSPENVIEQDLLRKHPIGLPEVSELDITRHFNHLAGMNFSVDKGFYPLGSCTMKYNPRINEKLSKLPGFADLHPLTPSQYVQGALQIMYELGVYLAEIGGVEAVTLQPAAGAHGELTGLLIMRAYHEHNGNPRKYVVIPDSAHGTNPASIIMAGYEVIQIQSGHDGLVDIEKLKPYITSDLSAVMITNPNTLGLFEKRIDKIAELVHSVGALLYMDGANLNALMGYVRPGEIGFDVLHFNLHKTFSTPHGGGGPGAGPVGVKRNLIPFLPKPAVKKLDEKFELDFGDDTSAGRVQAFWGAFGVMVKAYCYIRMLGAEGLKLATERAVLNSNYLFNRVKDIYQPSFGGTPMHEFVVSGKFLKPYGLRTLDVAKRLLDYGFHPPTVYFPLIVPEALMVEPTENESKQTLDDFADALLKIAEEAKSKPELLKEAPHNTPVRRLDEAKASRELKVTYKG